jgi:hypothetical protein
MKILPAMKRPSGTYAQFYRSASIGAIATGTKFFSGRRCGPPHNACSLAFQ